MSITEDSPGGRARKVRDWLDRMVFSPARTGPGPDPAPPVGGLDPITAAYDPEIIAAAIAYARRHDADPELRLLWARYALTASAHLWGHTGRTTVTASRVYQHVLTDQDLTFEAAFLAERRLVHGGPFVDEVADGCQYATTLHADGQCDDADQQIATVLRLWQDRTHDWRLTTTVLLTGTKIYTGCGRHTDAVNLLTRSRAHLAELDQRYRQLAASGLANSRANHHQRCASTTPTSDPPNGDALTVGFWLDIMQPPPSQVHRRHGFSPHGEPVTAGGSPPIQPMRRPVPGQP
ncbi:hypothetical protein ACQPZJ_44730 [Actinoplanes sp. CA-054009]